MGIIGFYSFEIVNNEIDIFKKYMKISKQVHLWTLTSWLRWHKNFSKIYILKGTFPAVSFISWISSETHQFFGKLFSNLVAGFGSDDFRAFWKLIAKWKGDCLQYIRASDNSTYLLKGWKSSFLGKAKRDNLDLASNSKTLYANWPLHHNDRF